MDCIKKYFNLNSYQTEKLTLYEQLFKEWNKKINLVSRKDIDFFCVRHLLHSMSICKYADLSESKVLDVGTGGGLPGIPLAIMYPEAQFLLIDSIGKKIRAVADIVEKLDLKNVQTMQIRSTELKGKYDYIVARAVTNFPDFLKSVKHLIRKGKAGSIENGILYLKGGDFDKELSGMWKKIIIRDLDFYFEEEFFSSKKLIHYKF